MANAFEEFVIKFKFDSNKVLKDLNKLAKAYKELEKVSGKARGTSLTRGGNKSETASLVKQNSMTRLQMRMEKELAKARALGMNVSGFQRSLTVLKERDKLDQRLLQLQKLVNDETAKQATASAKVISTEKAHAQDRIEDLKRTERAEKVLQTATERRIKSSLRARDKRRGQFGAFQASPAITSIRLGGGGTKADLMERKFLRAQAIKDTYRQKKAMAALGAEVKKTARAYNTLTKKTGALRTVQKGMVDSTRNMVRSYASLFAVFAATSSINKTGQSFEAMNSAMLAAMGSQEEAARQVEFLTGMTRRLGFSLLDTADQYTKFVFASKGKLDTEQVNTFFQSVAEAGTVLGVSKDRMRLSFNALQQMMNKTTVNSEELRRQLAESFPGAVQIFAKAAGVTEKGLFDMMQRGELLAADIFPAVAEEMKKVANTAGALDAKLLTTRIAQGRFFNELELASNKVFRSGFDKGFAQLLEVLTQGMVNNQDTLEDLGKTFQAVFKIAESVITTLAPPLKVLVKIVGHLSAIITGAFSGAQGEAILVASAIWGINASTFALNSTLAITALRFAAAFAPIYAALYSLKEIFALTTKGVVGDFELNVLGGDAGFDEKFVDKDGNPTTKDDPDAKRVTNYQQLSAQIGGVGIAIGIFVGLVGLANKALGLLAKRLGKTIKPIFDFGKKQPPRGKGGKVDRLPESKKESLAKRSKELAEDRKRLKAQEAEKAKKLARKADIKARFGKIFDGATKLAKPLEEPLRKVLPFARAGSGIGGIIPSPLGIGTLTEEQIRQSQGTFGGKPSTINNNTEITINTPSGLDPQETAKHVAEEVSSVMSQNSMGGY